MWKYLVSLVAAGATAAAGVAAQEQPVVLGSELEQYIRLLELEGKLKGAPITFRSPSALKPGRSLAADTGHIWSDRYPLAASEPDRHAHGGGVRAASIDPRFHIHYNSGYPNGTNDGAVWTGKGATLSLSGGVELRLGPLTVTGFPTVFHAQNREFSIVPVTDSGLNIFAYPWHGGGIDWPQRFGSQALTELDAGQTGIRLDLGAFTVGFSTENMWWGPGFRNPLTMSNTAAGFPHLDLGTGRPVWIEIGHLEVRSVWGRLAESDYFDFVSSNGGRLFVGLTLGYRPRWIPGLSLGATRVFYTNWSDSLELGDFLPMFQSVLKKDLRSPTNPTGDDDADQIIAIFARWVLPESGFEAFVEWGRNDHNVDLRDLFLEPDHSQAYTVGFHQLLRTRQSRIRIRGEWTHLERPRTLEVRPTPVWYVHHLVRQGYTHLGQLVGAGIGPGADGQYMGLDLYDRRGRLGLFLQRVRFDNDAYLSIVTPELRFEGHDVELTAGLSALRFIHDFDVSGALALSRRLNRNFELRNDVWNLNAQVGVRWRIK